MAIFDRSRLLGRSAWQVRSWMTSKDVARWSLLAVLIVLLVVFVANIPRSDSRNVREGSISTDLPDSESRLPVSAEDRTHRDRDEDAKDKNSNNNHLSVHGAHWKSPPQFGPGESVDVRTPASSSSSSPDQQQQQGGSVVQIMLGGDPGQFVGMRGLVRTLFSSATPACKKRLQVDIFVPEADIRATEDMVKGALLKEENRRKVRVRTPDPGILRMIPHLQVTDQGYSRLTSPYNALRFYVGLLYDPDTTPKVIYMDTDVISVCSICDMADSVPDPEPQESERAAAVVVKDWMNIGSMFVPKDKGPLLQKHFGVSLTTPCFNAGVMMLFPSVMKNGRWHEKVAHIIERNNKHGIWTLVTNPPSCVAFGPAHRHYLLDPKWHFSSLGWKGEQKVEDGLEKACVLHWNGKNKPWMEGSALKYHSHLWTGPVEQAEV